MFFGECYRVGGGASSNYIKYILDFLQHKCNSVCWRQFWSTSNESPNSSTGDTTSCIYLYAPGAIMKVFILVRCINQSNHSIKVSFSFMANQWLLSGIDLTNKFYNMRCIVSYTRQLEKLRCNPLVFKCFSLWPPMYHPIIKLANPPKYSRTNPLFKVL